MALAFLFAMLSVQPAFDELHFYTVHSWIGVVAFALFAFQVGYNIYVSIVKVDMTGVYRISKGFLLESAVFCSYPSLP